MYEINGKESGTVTLLGLHRNQAFILQLLKRLRDGNLKAKSSVMALKAYDSTLGKHQSWIVNRMVAMAMGSLPSTKVRQLPVGWVYSCLVLCEMIIVLFQGARIKNNKWQND